MAMEEGRIKEAVVEGREGDEALMKDAVGVDGGGELAG